MSTTQLVAGKQGTLYDPSTGAAVGLYDLNGREQLFADTVAGGGGTAGDVDGGTPDSTGTNTIDGGTP